MSKDKCHFTTHKGVKILIPSCMNVVNSGYIEDCVCIDKPIKEIRLKELQGYVTFLEDTRNNQINKQ
jgi:hypothetical protein